MTSDLSVCSNKAHEILVYESSRYTIQHFSVYIFVFETRICIQNASQNTWENIIISGMSVKWSARVVINECISIV